MGPRLWTTISIAILGISSYVHENMAYFSFKIDINNIFSSSVKYFPNWNFFGLVESSLILTSIVSSITICDPYSNWLGIGIQVLSFKSYSSTSPILLSIKVEFTFPLDYRDIGFIFLVLTCSIWTISIDISLLNK